MKIKNIDHFVITTQNLQACLDFYVGVLGKIAANILHYNCRHILTSTNQRAQLCLLRLVNIMKFFVR